MSDQKSWKKWNRILNEESSILFCCLVSVVGLPPIIGLVFCCLTFYFFHSRVEPKRQKLSKERDELLKFKSTIGLAPHQIIRLQKLGVRNPLSKDLWAFRVGMFTMLGTYLYHLTRLHFSL